MSHSPGEGRSFRDDVLALTDRFGAMTVELAFRLRWFTERPRVMFALRQLADAGQLHTHTTTVSEDGHVLTYFTPTPARYGRTALLRRLSVARLALDTGREFSGVLAREQLRDLLRPIGTGAEPMARMPFVVERSPPPLPSRLWLVSTHDHQDLQRIRAGIDGWASKASLAPWRRLAQTGRAGLIVFLVKAPHAAPGELERWFDRAPLLVNDGPGLVRIPVLVGDADPLRGGIPKKTKDR